MRASRRSACPHTDYGLAAYYIVAPAEASSNLARYDGVRYGYSVRGGGDYLADYLATRGDGFGAEVKRRIMLGTYALSAGYYDAFYLKAQKVRTLIKRDFDRLWEAGFDAIVAPTSPTVAFPFGSRMADPVQMYLSDVCTLPLNMAGLPGISIPCGLSDGLPVGLQLIGAAWSEAVLFRAARALRGDHRRRRLARRGAARPRGAAGPRPADAHGARRGQRLTGVIGASRGPGTVGAHDRTGADMSTVPGLAGVAFVAGILTVLGPCSLPILPLVLGAGAGGRAVRIAAVMVGFATTFLLTTVVIAAALAAAGLTTQPIRVLAGAVLVAGGAALAWPRAADWLGRRVPRRAARPGPLGRRGDIATGLAAGAGIGLLWAPCVGPIMASVIAAAVVEGPSAGGAFVAGAYVVGAIVPLAAIALGGRSLASRLDGAVRGLRLRQGYGILMLAAGLAVVTGFDLRLQAAVAAQPSDVAGVEMAAATGAPGASAFPNVPLEDLGQAPELAGITGWINSDPLTMASLRGKVVLVHFWTFACINCIHVQPYVKAWYQEYADQGLVVLGVHTPELSFERDLANVRQAVADDGVTFPVAFDPAFTTWNAYKNRYWPAFYFVDRHGTIRHMAAGEGGYDTSEAVIRELLAMP